MKKLTQLCMICFTLAFASSAFATWTLVVSSDVTGKNYTRFKILCTSDGSAMTATDIMATATTGMREQLRRLVDGSSLVLGQLVPGTAGVAPDTTIDTTLTDAQGNVFYATTGSSASALTTLEVWEDIKIMPPIVGGKLYLTISDIGTAGDQVTYWFTVWNE